MKKYSNSSLNHLRKTLNQRESQHLSPLACLNSKGVRRRDEAQLHRTHRFDGYLGLGCLFVAVVVGDDPARLHHAEIGIGAGLLSSTLKRRMVFGAKQKHRRLPVSIST